MRSSVMFLKPQVKQAQLENDPKYQFAKLGEQGRLGEMQAIWDELDDYSRNEYRKYITYHHIWSILKNHHVHVASWLRTKMESSQLRTIFFDHSMYIFRDLMANHNFHEARWLHEQCVDHDCRRRMFIFAEDHSLYWASWYGDNDMVNFIRSNCPVDDFNSLLRDRRPFMNSSHTGNLEFVKCFYTMLQSNNNWFKIQADGSVNIIQKLPILCVMYWNIAEALNENNPAEATLAIWDWHTSILSPELIQEMICSDDHYGRGITVFDQAIRRQSEPCIKWLYLHATEDYRPHMLTELENSGLPFIADNLRKLNLTYTTGENVVVAGRARM